MKTNLEAVKSMFNTDPFQNFTVKACANRFTTLLSGNFDLSDDFPSGFNHFAMLALCQLHANNKFVKQIEKLVADVENKDFAELLKKGWYRKAVEIVYNR